MERRADSPPEPSESPSPPPPPPPHDAPSADAGSGDEGPAEPALAGSAHAHEAEAEPPAPAEEQLPVKLFLGGLSLTSGLTPADLHDYFSQFGEITEARAMRVRRLSLLPGTPSRAALTSSRDTRRRSSSSRLQRARASTRGALGLRAPTPSSRLPTPPPPRRSLRSRTLSRGVRSRRPCTPSRLRPATTAAAIATPAATAPASAAGGSAQLVEAEAEAGTEAGTAVGRDLTAQYTTRTALASSALRVGSATTSRRPRSAPSSRTSAGSQTRSSCTTTSPAGPAALASSPSPSVGRWTRC